MSTNGEGTLGGAETRALINAGTQTGEANSIERARTSIHEHTQLKLANDNLHLQDKLADQQAWIEEQLNHVVDQRLRERETVGHTTTERSDAVDELEQAVARLTERVADTYASAPAGSHTTGLSDNIEQDSDELNDSVEKHARVLEDDRFVLDRHGQDIAAFREENAYLRKECREILAMLGGIKGESSRMQNYEDVVAMCDVLQHEAAQLKQQCAGLPVLEGRLGSLAVNGSDTLPNSVYDQHFRDVGEILGGHGNRIDALAKAVKDLQDCTKEQEKTVRNSQAEDEDDYDDEYLNDSDDEDEQVYSNIRPEKAAVSNDFLPSEIITYHESRIDSLERKLDPIIQWVNNQARTNNDKVDPQLRETVYYKRQSDGHAASDDELYHQPKPEAADNALEARVKILERGMAEQERRREIELFIQGAGVFALQNTFHKINKEQLEGARPGGLTFGVHDDDRTILKQRVLERLAMFNQVMDMSREIGETEGYAMDGWEM